MMVIRMANVIELARFGNLSMTAGRHSAGRGLSELKVRGV